MSTPTTPPRRIPGPVPKRDDRESGSFYSHVTDGPMDVHRVHNSADAGDAPPPEVVEPPPPSLAPSPYGVALPEPAMPTPLPPEPMMPDMMDAGAMGMSEGMMGGEGMASMMDPAAPLTPPDGGPAPTNPAEDYLLRGLLEGAGMRKTRPLGGGR